MIDPVSAGDRGFGFSDAELVAHPTVFGPDLFKGKVIVVSGGGSGIGKAIAILFARLGARLVLCGRKPEKLEATVALLRGVRDDFRLVRIRAAQALAGCPPARFAPEDHAAVLKATAELETSLNLRPDDSVSLYNLGNYHMTRGDLNAAVTNFEASLRLRPDFVPPAVNISLALNQLGRNADAERCLRAALVHAPSNSGVYLNLALLLGEQGRMEEARQAWLQVLAIEPRHASAAYNLAVITGATQPRDGAAWAARAAEWAPREWRFASAHAFYLRQAGDAPGALAALEKFVQQNPANGEAWFGLASAQAEAGQTAAAAETCRRALGQTELAAESRAQLQRLQAALPRR